MYFGRFFFILLYLFFTIRRNIAANAPKKHFNFAVQTTLLLN
nr:MAG TPA: hypothetical protein [Caudoviricetes sp.]